MVNLKRHKDFKYKDLLIRVTYSMNDNMQVKEMRGYTGLNIRSIALMGAVHLV